MSREIWSDRLWSTTIQSEPLYHSSVIYWVAQPEFKRSRYSQGYKKTVCPSTCIRNMCVTKVSVHCTVVCTTPATYSLWFLCGYKDCTQSEYRKGYTISCWQIAEVSMLLNNLIPQLANCCGRNFDPVFCRYLPKPSLGGLAHVMRINIFFCVE